MFNFEIVKEVNRMVGEIMDGKIAVGDIDVIKNPDGTAVIVGVPYTFSSLEKAMEVLAAVWKIVKELIESIDRSLQEEATIEDEPRRKEIEEQRVRDEELLFLLVLLLMVNQKPEARKKFLLFLGLYQVSSNVAVNTRGEQIVAPMVSNAGSVFFNQFSRKFSSPCEDLNLDGGASSQGPGKNGGPKR